MVSRYMAVLTDLASRYCGLRSVDNKQYTNRENHLRIQVTRSASGKKFPFQWNLLKWKFLSRLRTRHLDAQLSFAIRVLS